MNPADEPTAAEWEALQQCAADVVNSGDETESALIEQLFLYLDKLTSKYGERAYFLTIRADFTADRTHKRELLHQAYELASSAQQHQNVTEAAQSLARIALTDFPDIESAEYWLKIAREHLSRFDNNGSYREEDADLQRALDEMRQKRLAH